MELTDNILWLLKQAFYFSLTTINDAIRSHGVSTAQIGVLRQLANEPGLSGAESGPPSADQPAGRAARAHGAASAAAWWSGNRIPSTGGSCRPT